MMGKVMSILKYLGKYLLAVSLCFALFACSRITEDNFNKINNDMDIKEVTTILGDPTNSEAITIAGISGTSAIWKDKEAEIDIQFLNDKVVVKSYSKINELKDG